ncbi:MAG: molybdate ABC transporter substrate-binding protein [Frankiaceae bacterium]|nr:molybdate ABC transporter substrate-binding protein [Frankiaceae bacterium]
MRRVPAAVLAAIAFTGGCSSDSASGARTLTVFAASSLTAVLTAEGRAFETAHPGLQVRYSFAGSQALVAQLKQGAPADVLATADTATMASSGLADSRVFARNRLAIITAPSNPERVTTLSDLGRKGLRIVLAGPSVPVGKAAREALADAGVTVEPVSLEQDVKGVVSKVRLGEADAGIAYVTDVKAARGAVAGTELSQISNSYAVAVVKDSDAARAFTDFLLSAESRSTLASFGFLPPS